MTVSQNMTVLHGVSYSVYWNRYF